MNPNEKLIGWRASGLLVLLGLFSHGLLCFTDYVLWDGYWYYPELAASGGPAGMKRLFSEIGRPLDLIYLLPFTVLRNIEAPKIAGLIAWVVIPVIINLVLQRGARFPPLHAFAVSSVSAVLPVFDVLGEIALWPNTLALLIFWLGMVVLVTLPKMGAKNRIAWRVLSLLFLAISFNLNSLLVFFYALGVFLVTSRAILGKTELSVACFALVIKRHLDFMILPLVFWVAKSAFTPVHGFYLGYNQPNISVDRMKSGLFSLFSFLLGEAAEIFSSLIVLMLAVGLALIVAYKTALFRKSKSTQGGATIPRSLGWLAMGGGLFLLVAAAFPYAAVDQPLASFGWLSRNCILTALPISLLICGVALQANRLFLSDRPFAWMVPVAATLVLGVFACNRNYLQWQALGAKQDSIGTKLRKEMEKSTASVVQLRDYFIIPDTIYYYAPIVWTYIAAVGREAPETFVFDAAPLIPHQETISPTGEKQILFPQVPINSEALRQMLQKTTMPYMLGKIPESGRQLMFVVQSGKYGNDGVAIGLGYLWRKWFDPKSLPAFFEELTRTAVLELPPVGPS